MVFNSFKDLAMAMGIKMPKEKAEKPRKCSYCGQNMHRIEGTNVWACGNPFIVDAELDGQPVQVFGTFCTHVFFGEC